MTMRTPNKSKLYLFIALTWTLLLPVNAWAAQTVHIFLSIDGNQIEGESTVVSLEREGSIEAVSAGFNVFSTTDTSSGGTTGRHIYRPFTFLKRIDKATPFIFKALARSERVDSLEARFYRPESSSGTEEHFMTILLEDARIVGIVQTSESGVNDVLELVSVVFGRITMTYEIGGETHTDDTIGRI